MFIITHKGYRLVDKETKKNIKSKEQKKGEEIFFLEEQYLSEQYIEENQIKIGIMTQFLWAILKSQATEPETDFHDYAEETSENSRPRTPENVQEDVLRRSACIPKPKHMDEFITYMTIDSHISDPATYEDTMKSPEVEMSMNH